MYHNEKLRHTAMQQSIISAVDDEYVAQEAGLTNTVSPISSDTELYTVTSGEEAGGIRFTLQRIRKLKYHMRNRPIVC